jgi:colanic acid/amylovoran biosynthesis protein
MVGADMLYEIKGIGFPNKGAELMLAAVIDAVREFDKDARFCSNPSASYAHRSRFGLLQKITHGFRYVHEGLLGELVPKSICARYGLVTEKEVDVVLDASGYAYGDPWGAAKAGRYLADHIARYKRQGKTVVLLPQAFGPFVNPDMKRAMREILNHADLVFARDDISYRYLEEIAPSAPLHRFPDFTNLVVPRPRAVPPPGNVALIPNQKMVQMNVCDSKERYVDFIVKAAESVRAEGAAPFLLNHEGERDRDLASRVRQKIDIPCVEEEDARVIKAVIQSCRFIFSSRFHGIVSALSQGVPAIAFGWSHKYEALLESYDCKSLLVTMDNAVESLPSLIGRLMDDTSLNATREKILAAAEQQKSESRAMWRMVADRVGHPRKKP